MTLKIIENTPTAISKFIRESEKTEITELREKLEKNEYAIFCLTCEKATEVPLFCVMNKNHVTLDEAEQSGAVKVLKYLEGLK